MKRIRTNLGILKFFGFPNSARRPRRFIPTVESLESRCLLAVFTVFNTQDTGPGSLRQAIVDSNNTPGGQNTILFQIGSGVQTIFPSYQLDSITVPVSIDGSPPSQFPSQQIELDGRGAGATANGLDVRATADIFQLTVDNFGANGIAIAQAASGTVVESCFIGTDPSGTVAKPNGGDGVFINDSPNNVIGGTTPFERNLISGNTGNGVDIFDQSATGNQVIGNYIGTSTSGTRSIPNQQHGIFVNAAPNNTIGGQSSSYGNLVSGNNSTGVVIENPPASGNLVQGNVIGTDVSGLNPLNNGGGVAIDDAPNNTIGGGIAEGQTTGQPPGNLISGNRGTGITIDGSSTGNEVIGNLIGLDVTGNHKLANSTDGVYLVAGNNNIAAVRAAFRNVISGNGNYGVNVDPGADGNVIAGNYIGTNLAGSAALGNVSNGITIRADSTYLLTNVVSGNGVGGVTITSGNNTLLRGNFIGTDQSGVSGVGNDGIGLLVADFANGTTIGGSQANEGNIISGNGGDGIKDSGTNTNTMMEWNKDGRNINNQPLPNGGKGASLNGTGYSITNNFVSYNVGGGIDLTGSNDTISDNTVDDNGGEGIAVHSGTQNAISANLIYNNSGDGLFLDTGVTMTSVDANQIGLDQNGNAAGNAGNGIVVNDSSNVFAQNTIWYNQGTGIIVLAGIHDTITQNSIYLNEELGIDLGGVGIYPIHSQPEFGPNVFENYPSLGQVIVSGNTATVTGGVDTGPNTPGLAIDLEFFVSQTQDPTYYGQGQTWVGSATVAVTADMVPFRVSLPWDPALGTWYTATATPESAAPPPPRNPMDLQSTSEFSNAVGATIMAAGSLGSGNGGAGAALSNLVTPATAKLLEGNFIGLNRSDFSAASNRDEILANSESPGNTDGGTETALGLARFQTEGGSFLPQDGAPVTSAQCSDLIPGTSLTGLTLSKNTARRAPELLPTENQPNHLANHLDLALQELAGDRWELDPLVPGTRP